MRPTAKDKPDPAHLPVRLFLTLDLHESSGSKHEDLCMLQNGQIS